MAACSSPVYRTKNILQLLQVNSAFVVDVVCIRSFGNTLQSNKSMAMWSKAEMSKTTRKLFPTRWQASGRETLFSLRNVFLFERQAISEGKQGARIILGLQNWIIFFHSTSILENNSFLEIKYCCVALFSSVEKNVKLTGIRWCSSTWQLQNLHDMKESTAQTRTDQYKMFFLNSRQMLIL